MDVTLDPDTAYPSPVLSDSLRQVGPAASAGPATTPTERFSPRPCVRAPVPLAGRHSWEVEAETRPSGPSGL